MPAKVRIPAPLRKLTKEQPVVDIQGKTVEEILANLEKNYPGMKERICDENGQIRRFINVFVNGEDIRFKEGAKTSVAEGAEISIIPAIAGGTNDSCELRVTSYELTRNQKLVTRNQRHAYAPSRTDLSDSPGEGTSHL